MEKDAILKKESRGSLQLRNKGVLNLRGKNEVMIRFTYIGLFWIGLLMTSCKETSGDFSKSMAQASALSTEEKTDVSIIVSKYIPKGTKFESARSALRSHGYTLEDLDRRYMAPPKTEKAFVARLNHQGGLRKLFLEEWRIIVYVQGDEVVRVNAFIFHHSI